MTGKNTVRKEFLSDAQWVAPGGVTRVRATATAYLFSQLGTGNASALALNSNGDAYASGQNNSGQLGLGDLVARSTPTIVSGGFKWRQIVSAWGQSTLAITATGDAYAWGANASGQLGINSVLSKSTPTIISGALKWRQLVSTSNDGVSLGITSTGDAYAWGYNANGQLGTGDVVTRSIPTIVAGSLKWRQLSGGATVSYGIASIGDGYSWGLGANGSLGIGTPGGTRSTPTVISGGLTWKQISGGADFGAGITNTNDLYSWGTNVNGQLGLGDVVSRSTPTIVPGGLKWRYISAGLDFVVAVTQTGDAYAWGNNANGQLGIGTVVAHSTPTIVLGSRKWRQVSAGQQFVTGIGADCFAYAWGANASGELGNGTVVVASSPTLISGGLFYPVVYEVQTNSVLVTVVPGASYDVKTFGLATMVDYVGLYQDPYNSGAMPVKIILEYEA